MSLVFQIVGRSQRWSLYCERIVDDLEKCCLFSDFQYGFRSYSSSADLLTVECDGIARAFNGSRATRAVALDISQAFDRVWHAGLLHKLKSYEISGQMFGLISSFHSNRQFQVVLNGKSSQECPVRFCLNQPNRKRWDEKLVDVKHLLHKAFLL